MISRYEKQLTKSEFDYLLNNQKKNLAQFLNTLDIDSQRHLKSITIDLLELAGKDLMHKL